MDTSETSSFRFRSSGADQQHMDKPPLANGSSRPSTSAIIPHQGNENGSSPTHNPQIHPLYSFLDSFTYPPPATSPPVEPVPTLASAPPPEQGPSHSTLYAPPRRRLTYPSQPISTPPTSTHPISSQLISNSQPTSLDASTTSPDQPISVQPISLDTPTTSQTQPISVQHISVPASSIPLHPSTPSSPQLPATSRPTTRASRGIFRSIHKLNLHVQSTITISPLPRSHLHALRDPN
ncbi:classical arabinogalactan protein 9-like [Papaver somniferum]|uniref:classical arabinogalactan protein 9-like n=1 Tax=Papaver somniferum TaxID=3469 RepID=UPI000E701EED|nr:classical arabinogalactan protein 9-like [Papaver somniferum]